MSILTNFSVRNENSTLEENTPNISKIIDNDFHPLHYSKRFPQSPEDIQRKAIHIGDYCFIGANSIILKGTSLGKNCVVGAGSVVHGVWPDNSIIAGNPARMIRMNSFKRDSEPIVTKEDCDNSL